MKRDSKSKGSVKRSKSERSTKSENVHVTVLTLGSNVSHHDQSSEIEYKSVSPTATVMSKGVKRNVVGARGLLDPRAEKMFVCKSLLNKIKHKVKGTIKLKLHGYCSSIPENTYDIVTLFMPYWDNSISLDSIVVARLAKFILDTYKHLHFSQTYVWIDSKVTLSRLHSNKPLQAYVLIRMDELHSLLPGVGFAYISTKENPSDLLSRGVSATLMKSSSLWWEGPPWLKDRNS